MVKISYALLTLVTALGCTSAPYRSNLGPLTFPTYQESQAAVGYGDSAETEARCIKLYDRADHERLEDYVAGRYDSPGAFCADLDVGFEGDTCQEAVALKCDWLE